MSEENIEQVAQAEAPAMETPSEVASGGSGNEFLECTATYWLRQDTDASKPN